LSQGYDPQPETSSLLQAEAGKSLDPALVSHWQDFLRRHPEEIAALLLG
jgi:hypothetical protein